jgi:alpha-L-rhamnosidase
MPIVWSVTVMLDALKKQGNPTLQHAFSHLSKRRVTTKKILIGAAWALATLQAIGNSPQSLTVGDGFMNPIGFHDATPVFSWKLPSGVKKQTAYRIQAKAGKISWDSEWVETDQSTFVPYGGDPLTSREQIEWRVSIRDENGNISDSSESAHFEMGLLSKQDWKAQWIRPADATAPPEKGYKLVKAVYRSKANPNHSKDVLNLIENQKSAFKVGNAALGGDPALNEVKEIAITYTINGREKTDVYAEEQTVPFPLAAIEKVGLLRRIFPVEKKVARARIHVTARGLFELQLNGSRVGTDHFANGWTSYHKNLNTLTYDVTSQLKTGNNKLEALLGAGWYAGRLGWQQQKELYGKYPQLLLQLEVTYADGSSATIVSDGQWEGTYDGPVRSSSIYDGEDYDARKSARGWTAVTTHADLGEQRLTPKSFSPVREKQTLAVQTITEPVPGHFVFDLGQNIVGWARLKIPVEKDQTITIQFAEMLHDDGTIYNANYRSAKSTDTYIASETGIIEWQPHFTFHGFRYVELTGFPAGVKPQKDWVTGIVLHSDLKQTGKFVSSHAKLNQLQSNITWGWRGNSLDIPTDCPQRDERMGWTGDAQAFCPTAMLNYDCLAFFRSWLNTMRDEQHPDGRIPHVIPNAFDNGVGSPGWVDAATIIPWDLYVRTGDTQVLDENFGMMEKLVGWYRSQSVDGLTPSIKGFGDWLQPHATRLEGDTPIALLGAAYYAHSAQILADSARVLNRDSEAKRYSEEAFKVKQAFYKQYFDANGKLQNAPETQTAYILAIALNLVPKEAMAKAGTHLVRLIGEAGGHLRTGFLGTPLLAQALDQTGHGDLAYDLLFQETYPSWFYSINQGATTMWERWNSYTKDKGFGPVSMNSFNHYAYGAIGQWMYERIAGLSADPANPGYKHFFVRPLVGNQLDAARAELETPYGKASSAWVKKGEKLAMDVVVPPNTTATIKFPNGNKEQTVEAGTYHFEVDLK